MSVAWQSGRWRGILTSGLATSAAQGVSLVAGLISVPVIAHHVDTAEFGLWLNLTTASLAVRGALDFGLGSAVMTLASEARGRGDAGALRRVVATSLVALAATAVLVLVCGGAVVFALDWDQLLGMGGSIPAARVRVLMFAVAVGVAVSLPLMVARRVYLAFQHGHVVALYASMAAVVQTLGLWGMAAFTHGIEWFLAVYIVTSVLADLALTFLLLARPTHLPRPRLGDADRRAAGRLGTEGLQLLLLGGIGIVAFQTDTFIVGHYLGVARVPEYALPFKAFVLVHALLSMFLTPLWAAYREAWARGDQAWLRAAYVRSLVTTAVASTLISGALAIALPTLLHMWLGTEAVTPSAGFLTALACLSVVMCTSSTVTVFLRGVGVVRPQLWLGAAMAVLNIAVSIAAVSRFGLAGPLWATVITQTLVVFVPSLVYAHRCMRPQTAQKPATGVLPVCAPTATNGHAGSG
ncbi:lipopolysaccharide biosynthesis protein [Streptomyces sp. NPDC050287]|uniref:lipopolysaccharide biosynthesis protein n=1 Tax=Streptomyces sp. NPDC050287 TaxID=3365608 RepID=UPI0037B36225